MLDRTPRFTKPRIKTKRGYTVVDQKGNVLLTAGDIHVCMEALKAQRQKAGLFRNQDGALLAYTTGAFFSPSFYERKSG